MDASRRLSRALLVLLLADLLLQAWGLGRGWSTNPNLQAPVGDAETYWTWSADIAQGQLVAETPFLSAPLYPYFLGLIRALGGGMLTVFVLQLLLRSATAWLLARSARHLFGHAGYGIATAGLFLLLNEPAFYATRILNVSLQLFTVAAVIDFAIGLRACRQAQRNPEQKLPAPTPRQAMLLGLLLGVAVLSNPALLVVLALFAWWLGLRRPQLRNTLLAFGTTFLCLAPATLHNYLATRHSPAGAEFILLSEQAGVTFAHGNAEGANGTYHPLAGVSANRDRQNQDAYDYVKQETGEEGWGHTSSYFLHRGLDYLLANPADALALELRKLRWFFAGRHYGDVYNLTLESRDPAWPRPTPLPGGTLPLPWILPAAFLGLYFLCRRDKRDALPLAAMLLAPLFVVLVFWYSPRYRIPVTPMAVLLAPFGLLIAARALVQRFRKLGSKTTTKPRDPALLLAIAVLGLTPGLLLNGWSAATDFDSLEGLSARYELHNGLNALELGDPDEALRRFRRAEELGHEDAVLHESMAQALVQVGTGLDQAGQAQAAMEQYAQAIAQYRTALGINSTRLEAHFSLASVLDYVGKRAEARLAQQQGLAEAERQQDPQMIARFRQLGQRLR